MIPAGWGLVSLGDVISYRKGFAFNSKSYLDEGVRIIRISDTTRNSIHNDSPVYVSRELANDKSEYALDEGDIILSTVGSRPHLVDSMVGKAVQVPYEANAGLLNQNLVKLMPLTEKITNNYLFSMLKNPKFLYFISTLVRGNANQVSITLKELFQYKFVLPPLPEQKKIAKILSTWDKAIETVEKLIENSQQKKKALMQQLLTGKKRFPEFDGEWKEVRLGNIVEITTGSSKTKYIDENGERFILDMGSVSRDGKLIPSKRTSYADNHLFKGQLVMPKDDIGGGNIIGRVGYVDQDDKYILGDHVYALSVNTVDPLFLSYLINGFTVNKSLRRKANGTAQLGLGKKDVEKQVIVIPPSVKEQQQITSVLSSADQETETWQKELSHLKQEKKALMQQLLTGKRRVKVN